MKPKTIKCTVQYVYQIMNAAKSKMNAKRLNAFNATSNSEAEFGLLYRMRRE